ncbi:hypothetical protein M1L60_31855 [Actinoplanes sp. TRM 88003]|uniref:Uncharacterized protein n=1 Tax=Paractinoplanes aksuensis TaxID=2939490 RepID=A0ABT1DZZ7_9ACTN|nr:hypothetical protein [Actinoplanes aksuensis]MCO8275186.1 hypothetical protein [Actinoplanes aksuensis]
MNNILKRTEAGRVIARENWAKGFGEGIGDTVTQIVSHAVETALNEGLKLGRRDGLRVLLRERYGDLDDLDDLARRLADQNYKDNMVRIIASPTLEELRGGPEVQQAVPRSG